MSHDDQRFSAIDRAAVSRRDRRYFTLLRLLEDRVFFGTWGNSG